MSRQLDRATGRSGSCASPTSSTTAGSAWWARRTTAWSTGSPRWSSPPCCWTRPRSRCLPRRTAGARRRCRKPLQPAVPRRARPLRADLACAAAARRCARRAIRARGGAARPARCAARARAWTRVRPATRAPRLNAPLSPFRRRLARSCRSLGPAAGQDGVRHDRSTTSCSRSPPPVPAAPLRAARRAARAPEGDGAGERPRRGGRGARATGSRSCSSNLPCDEPDPRAQAAGDQAGGPRAQAHGEVPGPRRRSDARRATSRN